MAAYITQNEKTTQWHVGEPLPEINARIVTIQADGDELVAILRALKYKGTIPGERIVK